MSGFSLFAKEPVYRGYISSIMKRVKPASDKLAIVSQRPMLVCSLRKQEVPGSIHNKVCNYIFLFKLLIRAHVSGRLNNVRCFVN